MAEKSWTIYVLRLTGGKYYIGKTTNLLARLDAHRHDCPSHGSSWTDKYIIEDCIESVAMTSKFHEDNKTLEYMGKYGIDNVRGGSFCSVELDQATKDHIQKQIWHTEGKCLNCGSEGHYAKTCEKTTNGPSSSPTNQQGQNQNSMTTQHHVSSQNHRLTTSSKKYGVCYRCGRPGHFANQCYARTTVDGGDLDSDSDDSADSDQ
jgi:predicted GIY-YIG superfamily endonuclease